MDALRRTPSVARVVVLVATALSLALCSAPAPARAADPIPAEEAPGPRRYFYKGYDYGSQSLYNPVYVLLNRGFDTLQLRPKNRNVYGYGWLLNGRNVAGNVADPFVAIRNNGGFKKFATEELLPLSWTFQTARWAPNYGLHLIGGGETYAELREWFEAHDAAPALAVASSVATLYTAAFINEMIENRDVVGTNTDALADLCVFDLAGILLFSIEPVKLFFSKYVVLSDWSLQPAFVVPSGDLHNQGNYYAAKIHVPFVPRLSLFGYEGYSSLGGLSVDVGRGYSISAAAGSKVATFQNVGTNTVENVITTAPAAAVFVDRHESLLASVEVANVSDYFIDLNVYPNAVFHTDPGFGMFAIVSKDGHVIAGVSFTRALGFGLGVGSL